jgi:hypothetical protein
MKRHLLAASLVLGAGPVHAADSAYSKVDFDRDCKLVEEDDIGGSWLCAGYRGVPIHFAEGDLRQSAFYGEVGGWFAEGAFESFTGFNHTAETVEWRLDNGIPFATIRRWFIATGEDDTGKPRPEAQVLVVSKVGQPGDGDACVVGYVEATANPDANRLARQVADVEARDFACRAQQPQWHGLRKAEITESRYFGSE